MNPVTPPCLSYPYWASVMKDAPDTNREREFATFALGLMEATKHTPELGAYLAKRSQQALGEVS